MARHGYRGDGAFGQFCVVLPAHDAVIVTTAGTEAMQAVLDNLGSTCSQASAPAEPTTPPSRNSTSG